MKAECRAPPVACPTSAVLKAAGDPAAYATLKRLRGVPCNCESGSLPTRQRGVLSTRNVIRRR